MTQHYLWTGKTTVKHKGATFRSDDEWFGPCSSHNNIKKATIVMPAEISHYCQPGVQLRTQRCVPAVQVVRPSVEAERPLKRVAPKEFKSLGLSHHVRIRQEEDGGSAASD